MLSLGGTVPRKVDRHAQCNMLAKELMAPADGCTIPIF